MFLIIWRQIVLNLNLAKSYSSCNAKSQSRQRRLIGLVRQFVFLGVSDRLIQRIFTLIESFLLYCINVTYTHLHAKEKCAM